MPRSGARASGPLRALPALTAASVVVVGLAGCGAPPDRTDVGATAPPATTSSSRTAIDLSASMWVDAADLAECA